MIAPRLAALVIAALLLAACGGSAPPPTATITPTPFPFPTVVGVATRPPLQPTWTPTLPPSPTITQTPPPSPTPRGTLTGAEICEQFAAVVGFADGGDFNYFDPFLLEISLPIEDATASLRFTERETGVVTALDIPGGDRAGMLLLTFDQVLPGAGTYAWRLTVTTPAYTGICMRGGFLNILKPSPLRAEFGRLATWAVQPPPSPTPTATATAPATATPDEQTPEVTPEP